MMSSLKHIDGVTIIGAGIIGILSALAIKDTHPDIPVCIISSSQKQAATTYSAALITPFNWAPTKIVNPNRCIAAFQAYKDKYPSLNIRRHPTYVAYSDIDMLQRAYDGSITGVSLADFQNLYPECTWLELPNGYRLAKVADSLAADANSCMQSFREILLDKGVIFQETQCTNVSQSDDGKWLLLNTDTKDNVTADKVVLATGAHNDIPLVANFWDKLAVSRKKIVAFHIDAEVKAQSPVVFLPDDQSFLLPMPDSQEWLFSITSNEWNCVPDSSQLQIGPQDRSISENILNKYGNGLLRYVHGGRVFCDAYSMARQPLVKQFDEYKGIIIATGGSGSGFRYAPHIATKVVESLQLIG